ncbi:MAG: 50S ribosomal protein L6 [Firmicutes bacterium]|jgi:large subunit ribosomal protein L6|nr:50S ribosomal protein L6 [Bacillota bacterium]
MSRVGKAPIPIPKGVEATIEGATIKIKGPKGALTRRINPKISVSIEDGNITVGRSNEGKEARSLHGLTRTLIANMVQGVTEGYQKTLLISGTGYRATQQGNKLVLGMGLSHPVEMVPPEGIEIEVPSPTRIVVKGIDKELVGQISANIRAVRPPEPYKGKGIRYEGERIRMKAGKAGKAAGAR